MPKTNNKKIKNINRRLDDIQREVKANLRRLRKNKVNLNAGGLKTPRIPANVRLPALNDDSAFFAAGLLDPNHNNQITRSRGIPDNASRRHVMFTSVYHKELPPDGHGNLCLYMLPFPECPLMRYDTETGDFIAYPDPKLPETYFKDNKVYAFRCVGQGVTAYNASSAIANGGVVTAARFPSIIDNHAAQDSGDSTNRYGTCYVRTLEGLPTSADAVSSSTSNPYTANAAYGCYMVNRNMQPDFPFIYRNSDWDKSTTTIYKYDGTNRLVSDGNRNVNVLAVLPYGVADGTLPTIVKLDPSAAASLLQNSIAVSGMMGTGFETGCIFFSGLPENSSIMVKVCHGYEMLVKPTSSLLSQIKDPLIPDPSIIEAVVRDYRRRDYQALRADANFWGELWNGFKKVAQAVKPLTTELVNKFVPANFQPLANSVLQSVDNLTGPDAPQAKPGITNPVTITTRPNTRGRY